MGRERWEGGQAAEAGFDVGLFVCLLLPGPPTRGAGTVSCGRNTQDGHQQPAGKMAADVDDRCGWHQIEPNQGKPERMRSGNCGEVLGACGETAMGIQIGKA